MPGEPLVNGATALAGLLLEAITEKNAAGI